MKKVNYARFNPPAVLDKVNAYIDILSRGKWSWERKVRIDKVYDVLSIFDWWKEDLSISQLKDMRRFLKTAISLGFDGYVCFKVGATGCANGMWAHKAPTTDGYSPNGPSLYKSFVCDYNCWDVDLGNGFLAKTAGGYYSIKTIKDLKALIAANN